MKNLSIAKPVLLLSIVSLLSGCSNGVSYQKASTVAVLGETSSLEPRAGIVALFEKVDTPYTISFYGSMPNSGEEQDLKKGHPHAKGVGGLFVPLLMEVKGLEIKTLEKTAEGYDFTGNFISVVNKIPPVCSEVKGQIEIDEEGALLIRASNFYCNWVIVGNVLNYIKLSVDAINPETGRFTGYYSFRFNGTGNALGAGYLLAQIDDFGGRE